jgi:hypothetical protein
MSEIDEIEQLYNLVNVLTSDSEVSDMIIMLKGKIQELNGALDRAEELILDAVKIIAKYDSKESVAYAVRSLALYGKSEKL